MGPGKEVEHDLFIYYAIFILDLDTSTTLQEANAENKQLKTESTPRDYYTPLSFLEQAVPGKQEKATDSPCLKITN